ncbi:MAG: phage tail tape measure protein, partial [Clostridia bacterium]
MAFSAVLGEALVPIRAQLDKLREDLQNAKQQVERDLGKTFSDVGKTLKDAGQKISTYVTLPILGTGAAILRTAGDFEASMNRVRALTGATGQEFEALRNQAKELGRTTQFSASQAADAMGFLAMAGFDVNQILGA